MPPIASVGGCTLRDYGGRGPTVVFVPSLINPPHVLDLNEGNSLLRWLGRQGLRPLLVDWGEPGPAELPLSIDGYVSERLVPLLESLAAPAMVAGYCLGGTMALAAAALTRIDRLALIATPWHFDGYAPDRLSALGQFWQHLAPSVTALGRAPMDLIQPAFWRLDPTGTVGKFERFAQIDPASAEADAFVALEDWLNDGPPLTLRVAEQCFSAFFGDDLPGSNRWQVAGRTVDPAEFGGPVLNIVSTRDQIVPAAAAPRIGHRIDIDAGHVGMVIGGGARRHLWEPLRDWLLA